MRRLRRAAVKLYRNCIYILVRAMQMRTAACALKIHLCECLCGEGGDVGRKRSWDHRHLLLLLPLLGMLCLVKIASTIFL